MVTYMAEQQLRAEHFADAIGTLEQAAKEVRAGASRFYEPEIVRLGGEILLAQSAANAAQAESVFRQAMAPATEQSCRMLELQSAVSLARLLGSDGRSPRRAICLLRCMAHSPKVLGGRICRRQRACSPD